MKSTTAVYYVYLCAVMTVSKTASFYGASYVSVPLQDASSDTDIFFRFKTLRADSLLFLAAGPPDYCFVTLHGGEIKVRINLGSGEEELTSVPGLKLNDLLWHEIEIQKIGSELNLRIDGIHTTYLDIKGRFLELNVKSGIFIGGLGGFDELFLGNLKNFRGCLDEFFFNNMDILGLAVDSADELSVHGVTWDCSDEFEASSHQPISFIENESFVALPALSTRNGGSVSFDVRTQSELAVLFYNSGNPSETDFLAVEIIGGKLTLSVNEGNGVVVLKSDNAVNDGHWHQVETQFSPTYVELTVDGESKNIRPGLGENRFFDFTDYLYVGGIEPKRKTRALQQGLQSVLAGGANSSLAGCLKNIKINNEVRGHREVEVSQGIRSDCVWEYPCLQKPCIEEGVCFQEGLDRFRCTCESSVCVRSNFSSGYRHFTKSSLPLDVEILALNPLEVSEGGNDLITSKHISIVLDYQKYGVRESGVLFHIVESPKHGTLEIEIWNKIADNIFTLLDLYTDKVRYTHDGSENHNDEFVTELEFRARNYRLPPFLEERHRFVFHIKVSPVNDPPQLILPPSKVLRLAKHTKIALTSDVLHTEDPDNEASSLVYSVLSIRTDNEGFVENIRDPGKPVDTFTQEEINNKQINYVHRGPANTRIAMRVSDGIETGQPMVLRVATFDLMLILINNTGIVLPYNSYAVITNSNLTFATNSPDQDLEIRYDVTRLPQHGNIQKRRNNGRWRPVNHFTQRQVNKLKVRYVHTSGKPSQDEFKFSVSCMDIKMSTIYDFRILFITVSLIEVSNNNLVLNKTTEDTLTSDHLQYQTSPVETPTIKIHYTILSLPSYGHLFLTKPGVKEPWKLKVGSVFTQEDIGNKFIKYKLLRKSYSAINDTFYFKVASTGVATKPQVFSVIHIPVVTGAMIEVEKLHVLEGGQTEVNKGCLYVKTATTETIIFNVTDQPQHGVLRLMNSALTGIEKDYPVSFSNKDIEEKRLLYIHDDSEHNKDKIRFTAFAEDSDDDFVYYGTLHIGVTMENDNPPVRSVDKIFFVQINGERKLTSKDLRYDDLDIDSKPTDIQYTRRGIPNGALFHTDSLDTQVFQFTQDDLDEERLLFRHNGPSYGKAVLWITDGQFYVTGILEIQASDPFINVTRNTGLIVQRGDTGCITTGNLSVETNVGLSMNDLTFKVVSRPRYGELTINGNVVHQFRYRDLELSLLEYENDNNPSFSDSFQFLAFVEEVSVDGIFNIQVFPESFWESLQVLSNKTIYVDEGKAEVIDPASLNIAHTNINPANISYIITLDPQMGYIRVNENSTHHNMKTSNKTSIRRFTQALINEGVIEYVQTKSNVSYDYFIFDVTNGITTMRGLQFTISIISNVILLRTRNITVVEGGETSLTLGEVNVANPYYNDWISEYLVIEEPKHGYLTNSKLPGSKLLTFSLFQLKSGLIHYTHDGTETTRDWFTVVAKAATLHKESAPSSIHVTITPVNDETPHLINNTGLEVWEGSLATITNHHLAAGDDDSGPNDIVFDISALSNGYVALKNDTKTPIEKFSQDDINRGLVIFVHTGESAGGFRIQVSDGFNKDSPHVFTVTARELKLILEVNEKLRVLPRMQQSVTKDHLSVTTNDKDSDREIVYHVRKEPEKGRILLENPGGALSPVTQFTQGQIDKNMLLYEHMKPMKSFATTDTIIFDIETQHADPLKGVAFNIEISVDNLGIGNLEGRIQLNPLDVLEGGNSSVGPEHIDLSRLLSAWQGKEDLASKLEIIVEAFPTHGWVSLDNENISESHQVRFNRTDVRDRLLVYHHDDSDTFSDVLTLGFYISGDEAFPHILLYNGTLHINVTYVNDQPFELMTKTPKIDVVQGQKMVISSDDLYTKDLDGVPKDIIYEIISNATNGFVVKKENETHLVQSFTQEDLDNGLLSFVHDGSKRPGTFHFKVSDGKHKPVYKAFNIIVVPLSLTLVNKTMLELLQGTTTVTIKPKNLGASTNGDSESILYKVTKEPTYGRTFIGEQIISQFKQKDINNGSVYYMQLDMTVSQDYFVVTVTYGENILSDQIINITVVPLVKQGPFEVRCGDSAVLTLGALDASKLAEQTDSDPVYSITKQPKYGYLQKVATPRVRREAEVLNRFTHHDIIQKVIIYNSKDIEVRGSVADRVEYVLTAPGVQPALGRFVVILQPKIPSSSVQSTSDVPVSSSVQPHGLDETTLEPAVDDREQELEDNVHTPPISDDHLLVICLVVGLVVLTLAIVLIIKYLAARQRSKRSARGHIDGKVPGSQTAQTDLNPERFPSNVSASLSDELPPPVPPTSPSSLGSSCRVTPKRGVKVEKSKHNDMDPTPPPPPYGIEGSEWTEVSPTVPTCKVTPLTKPDKPEVNETTLNAPYNGKDSSEPSENKEWSQYEDNSIRYGASNNPVLRKNQYWV